MNTLLKVVIDRAKWLRGTGNGTLLRDQPGKPDIGKMCCLGFVAKAVGMSDEQITERGDISSCLGSKPQPESIKGLFISSDGSLNAEDLLIKANDGVNVPAKERERTIKRLGKAAGIAFSFIGRTR